MIEKMDKIIGGLFQVLKAVLVVLLLTMIVILVAHIWFRYVINQSLTWSEELMKILLVWFGMLSVSVLAVRREHVAIVIFKEKMPESVGRFLGKLTQGLIVVICLVMIVVGFQYVITAGYRLTPALRIPYGWAYASVPISFILVTFFELRNFLVDVSGKGPYAAIEKPEEDLTGGSKSLEL
ncbi:MAG: TRAP transporter small permease [Eubacteriales bacterium]|jgi:TRAP-type C4-dicarboxylate transport system permease small subunit